MGSKRWFAFLSIVDSSFSILFEMSTYIECKELTVSGLNNYYTCIIIVAGSQ